MYARACEKNIDRQRGGRREVLTTGDWDAIAGHLPCTVEAVAVLKRLAHAFKIPNAVVFYGRPLSTWTVDDPNLQKRVELVPGTAVLKHIANGAVTIDATRILRDEDYFACSRGWLRVEDGTWHRERAQHAVCTVVLNEPSDSRDGNWVMVGPVGSDGRSFYEVQTQLLEQVRLLVRGSCLRIKTQDCSARPLFLWTERLTPNGPRGRKRY